MKINTLKRERQRGNWSRFAQTLLALLVIFGISHSARAQAVFFDDAIAVTQQPINATSGTTINYAGRASSVHPPYSDYARLGSATNAAVPSFGNYDLTGNSQLVLNGGSLVIQTANGGNGLPYTITSAGMQYRVYRQGGAAPVNNTSIAFASNGNYTAGAFTGLQYQNFAANANLLSGITLGGTYVLEVRFNVAGTSASDGANSVSDPDNYYSATFNVAGPSAPTLTGTLAYISPNASGNQTYNVNPDTPNPYQGANLGDNFNINGGQLILNGGAASTTETSGGSRVVNNVTLYYRVRQQNTSGGAFSFITLPQTANNSGTRTFFNNTANINLINLVAGAAGTYTLDIYYQASGTDNSTSPNPTPFTILDNRGGLFYNANFTVVGTAIPVTRWVGGTDDNWFDSRNWTNGIPDRNTNAEVQNLGTGNKNPYPNIYAAVKYRYRAADSVTTKDIDNTAYALAEARNLTMLGTSQANRSILRLIVGTLNVYGDFDNTYDSFIARNNTVVGFVGTNQTISSGSFSGVRIAGGGAKSLQGVMNVSKEITFVSGLLVTNITEPSTSVVVLADRGEVNAFQGAQLNGETSTSYLRGFVRTSRVTTDLNTEYTYGNIGMRLFFTGTNDPGQVDVTRNTSEYYSQVGNASGIRRIFGVRPANPGTNTRVLSANLEFRYLDGELEGLGQSGSVAIDENNLALFLSLNSGNTFANLGRTSINTTTNTLSLDGVTDFATFTLGDRTNPLPVHLVAFDAKRQATNTLVTWATADETNSAGFEVQVSNDGKTYRNLAFVASAAAARNQYKAYTYTDIEASKSGLRYYRLRQVDIDGTSTFSPVKVVSFATLAAGSASVNVYPNPSISNEQTTLVVQSPVAGTGHIQVLDMTGRSIASRDITTVAGVTELALPVGSDLNAGIYMVKVTLPTGETKTVRMQKR